jgi:hypothetical protein
MRLRLTKVDEFQLLTCLRHSLWGSRSARFRDWKRGDFLGVIVDKALAALAEVAGEPFQSRQRVWDDGLFPHRIPIRFVHFIKPDARPPILGEVRDALTSAWGPTYGWGILNQNLLVEKAANTIINAIRSRLNDLDEVQGKLEEYLDQANQQRQRRPKQKRERKGPEWGEVSVPVTEEVPSTKAEESAHAKIQNALIQLGRITGCSVWIASNDRNRGYKGKRLGEGCLKSLPNLGLNQQAAERISFIDIIWVRQNSPVSAFEVETTTSVYSGLLRMSDLLALVPALNIKLYIVAPKERLGKVMGELARPTFQKIGLSEFCRFVPSEELESLLARIGDFEGHVQPSIVDRISIQAETEPTSALK